MTRALLAAVALVPLAARAQDASDPALAPTAAAFEADLATVVRLATAAALVHERTGAFPADAFGILGSPEGAATGARALPLSRLAVEAPPAEAAAAVGAFTAVPLPAPYVRDDEQMRVVVLREADGRYTVQYRITRHRDPDLGGGRLAYESAPPYDVRSGVGSVCIDPATARAMLADGAFVPDAARLAGEPLTVRVVPPGADAPVYYQTTRSAAP